METRHYQRKAVDATIDWFLDGKEKPLIVLPTGTGKSLVQATLIREILEEYPHVRFVCATHSQELVEQNHNEIIGIWPACPAGIYSAGLGRRERHAQVLFASIQSIYNKAVEIRSCDIIIVDECHTISEKSESRWARFFHECKLANPNVQIIGMSATPYRMDSGNLVPRTFSGISYEYPITDAIKEGYLAEVVSAQVVTRLNTVGVGKRGGEFIPSQLEAVVNVDHLTVSAINEVVALGADRKSWLGFCAGNAHAHNVCREIKSRGIECEVITKDTDKKMRREIIAAHKSGELRALVNNMVLTTGYNNPRLDLIFCLRPTQSCGLWVQMVGRGMRLFEGKQNCLLLDFGRNLERHGPIDQIKGSNTVPSEGGGGDAPMKQCPSCYEPCHSAARVCPNCEFEFPMDGEPDIDTTASDAPVFSTQNVERELGVLAWHYKAHKKNNGKPDTLKVSYITSVGIVHEFVCFNHPAGSFPRKQATAWAREHGKNEMHELVPSVEAAEKIEWLRPQSIFAKKDGKYWKINKKYFLKST